MFTSNALEIYFLDKSALKSDDLKIKSKENVLTH